MKKAEQIVRECDDETISIIVIAEEIAPKIGLKVRTCICYLSAKRMGFSSYRENKDHLAKQRGYKSESEVVSHRYYEKKLDKKMEFDSFVKFMENLKEEEERERARKKEYITKVQGPPVEPTELEKKVRALDENSPDILDQLKILAEQEKVSEYTLRQYLYAKKRGFRSHKDYANYWAIKQGFRSRSEKQTYQYVTNIKGRKRTLAEFRKKRRWKKLREK